MRVRQLQHIVFRMQHDPAFAARVLEGDADTLAALRLSEDEQRWLCAPGAAAYGADRGRRRRVQFLRNVTGEFVASRTRGPSGEGDDGWSEQFLESEEFHQCVAGSGRLPLAFADYAARRGRDAGDATFCALVDLEAAMARARRSVAVRRPAARGEVVLAPWVQLYTLPAGTHALAVGLREGGRMSGRADAEMVDEERAEIVLLVADEREPPPGALRTLRVEALSPVVALFLRNAESPWPRRDWDAFADTHDLEPADVESVAAEFVADRVLLDGPTELDPSGRARV